METEEIYTLLYISTDLEIIRSQQQSTVLKQYLVLFTLNMYSSNTERSKDLDLSVYLLLVLWKFLEFNPFFKLFGPVLFNS